MEVSYFADANQFEHCAFSGRSQSYNGTATIAGTKNVAAFLIRRLRFKVKRINVDGSLIDTGHSADIRKWKKMQRGIYTTMNPCPI